MTRLEALELIAAECPGWLADIVRFEAKQQIPFPLEEVVWDFQKINSGQVTDGFAMETEIGLFAMKRDMVNRALTHFRDVNVEVHIIQMVPLALVNYVAYDLLGYAPDAPLPGRWSVATAKSTRSAGSSTAAPRTTLAAAASNRES